MADVLVRSGVDWALERGIPRHSLSVVRVGDHAHIINCMFDHPELAAIVSKGGPGYSSKVTPANTCQTCNRDRQ